MSRTRAWSTLAAMAVASTVAFLLPLPYVAALLVAAFLWLRVGRIPCLAFIAFTIALDALLFAFLLPGPGATHAGPLAFGWAGAARGAAGGLRVVAVLTANLALLSWVPPARLLDGLGLPAALAGFLGAVLLAGHDLGRDARRLVLARRLEGRWPRGLLARAAAAASLVAPWAVLALRRARVRADALRLAGHDTGPSFAPLVAVTALAVAARLALAAGANVSLAYVVVFSGGVLFGPRVGFFAGLLAMAVTDLLLSGLYPVAFANAPAMGLVGLLGAALRRVDFSDAPGRLLAAAIGLVATVLFSIGSDVVTWLVVPEFHASTGALRVLVVAGLAFNVLPAVANALLFAAAVGPVASAAREAGVLGRSDESVPREAGV